MLPSHASVPLGNLIATPDFLSVVPRPAMIAALRSHASPPGGPDTPVLRSEHSHEGWDFQLVSVPEQGCTYLCLAHEG